MKQTSKKKDAALQADATPEEKKKALDAAISKIEKSFGHGAIMKMGEKAQMNVSAVSTGSLTLDMALGVGGLPRGRIIEIYGPESSGKTTIALHAVAEVQKLGGEAAFIDAEHALDPVYAKALGVDIDELLVSQPDSGEQALEIAEALGPLRRGGDHRNRLRSRARSAAGDRGRHGLFPRRTSGTPYVSGRCASCPESCQRQTA